MATVTQTNPAIPLTKNEHLLRWVDKMAELTGPANIHWVDGSQEEYDQLCDEMVASGSNFPAAPAADGWGLKLC